MVNKMSDMIMKKGKAVGLETNTVAQPLGIEYEKLMRNLKNNVEKRYDKQDMQTNVRDMRKSKQFALDQVTEPSNSSKTFLIQPGTADKGFDEPNGKPAYPQTGIPYSQGQVWSD